MDKQTHRQTETLETLGVIHLKELKFPSDFTSEGIEISIRFIEISSDLHLKELYFIRFTFNGRLCF
jgi:hypothetical protein